MFFLHRQPHRLCRSTCLLYTSKHYEKGERKKRTHRLCKLGGMVESVAPEVKDLTRTEMTELMEHIFSLSEVQRAGRHMAITPVSYTHLKKSHYVPEDEWTIFENTHEASL